jgi:hypothetical protein
VIRTLEAPDDANGFETAADRGIDERWFGR